jgi:hypothetical protein
MGNYYVLIRRLSQNFSFWKSVLGFKGKNGLLAAFPKVIPVEPRVRANRILGMALCAFLFLYASCTSPGAAPDPKGEDPAPPALIAPPSALPENGLVLAVDNPTRFTVYFEKGQKVAGKSGGAVSLAVEDATLTGGFDILYEIPLSDTVRLFCKGDHKTIRENQKAFTITEPHITENYGTYVKISNTVNNAVSFYTGGEAVPSWEQQGDPLAGSYLARTNRREFSEGETPVFMVESNSRQDSYFIRDSGKNIPLVLPPQVEGNYLYSFEYSGAGLKLLDARLLSRQSPLLRVRPPLPWKSGPIPTPPPTLTGTR